MDSHWFPAFSAEAAERHSLLEVLGPVSSAGRRGLLAFPAVSALARSVRLIDLVRPHLPHHPLPVRAIYFDKSPDANWGVAWHQDLTLALRARVEVAGFGPWSTKDGIPHVQPPVELLQQMLTIRLHLDDAGTSNGALRVLPRFPPSGGAAGPGASTNCAFRETRFPLCRCRRRRPAHAPAAPPRLEPLDQFAPPPHSHISNTAGFPAQPRELAQHEAA